MELLTFMEPLCASMIWRVMASPRPVPSGLKVLKGVKISGSCSGEIPHPLSSTEMRSLPAEQLAWIFLLGVFLAYFVYFRFQYTHFGRGDSAFANTDGGRLLIGVKDNGAISGEIGRAHV